MPLMALITASADEAKTPSFSRGRRWEWRPIVSLGRASPRVAIASNICSPERSSLWVDTACFRAIGERVGKAGSSPFAAEEVR